MSGLFLASLLLASTTPQSVTVIPHPDQTLPRLEPVLEWLSHTQPYLSPRRIRKRARLLRIDPFEPKAWERFGIDVKKPIQIWSTGRYAPAVLELELADIDKADRFMRRLTKRRNWSPLKKGPGIFRGLEKDPDLVVRRFGKKLFIQAGPTPHHLNKKHLALIRGAQRASKGKHLANLLKPDEKETEDFLFAGAQMVQEVKSGVAHLWLKPGRIVIEVEVKLSLALNLLAADIATPDRPSRPLLFGARPGLEPAAELTANLGPSLMANAVMELGLTDKHARVLTGEIHLVLTKKGSAVFAAQVNNGATKQSITELIAALKKLKAKAKYVEAERLLLAWYGGADESAVDEALAKRKTDDKKGIRAPVELRIAPDRIMEALKQRTRARKGPRVGASRLGFAELKTEDLLRRTSSLRATLARDAGRLVWKVEIDYAAKQKGTTSTTR